MNINSKLKILYVVDSSVIRDMARAADLAAQLQKQKKQLKKQLKKEQ